MADRTVRVILTGTATPYTTAVRNAARQTQRAATQMRSAMRDSARQARSDWQAASRQAQAQMRSWASSAQAAARRASAAVDSFSRRARAQMRSLRASASSTWSSTFGPALSGHLASAQARIAATASRIQARWAGMTARMTGAWGTVTAGASAAAARITARMGGSAGAVSSRWAAALSALGAGWAAVAGAASSAASTVAARWSTAATTVSARWATAMGVMGTASGLVTTRAGAAATAVAARWATAAAAISSRWAVVTATASAAASAMTARLSAAAGAVSARWAGVTAGLASGWGTVTSAAGSAASAVAARWTTAASAVSARWASTTAAVSGAMTAAASRASAAAAAVAARWAAATAAVRAGMAGMASAAAMAGAAAAASMISTANNAQRSLKAVRAASIGLVAVFGLAAYAAANFEKAMSNVKAVTGATGRELDKLRDAALEAGRTTQYSASQAANAAAELARAGIKTADIIGGALKGSLSLAAAGQLDLAESAIISAQAMNTFGLQGKDVGHIADVLAAAANKSATNVHDMGMALRMGGLLASQTGLSLEDTAGALAAFADRALYGSDAGTSLKVMLQRLVPQSKEAQAAMDKVGFSAYDSSGRFVGLTEMSQRLKDSFSGLTPEARNAAFATIFGSDAVRSATILYELGAAGVNKYIKAVDDQGAASRMAATQTDNLIGDLERLKSALEGAFIESGTAANAVLREMAQWVTKVVNAYASLPPGVQQTVTILSGLVGVLALVGAGFLLLLPRILLVKRELIAMGLTATRVRGAMLGLGKIGLLVGVMAGVGVGIESLIKKFSDGPPSVAKLSNSLIDFARKGTAAGELSRVFGKDLDEFGQAVQRIAHPTNMERFNNAMDEIFTLGMADPIKLREAREEIQGVDQALADMVTSGAPDVAASAFSRLAKEAEKGGTSTEKFRTLLPGYTDALAATDAQAKLTAGGQKKLGDQTETTADEMADQRSEAEKLADALSLLNGAAIGTAEAEISFRESLKSLSDAVKENGRSLDTNSEKGRAVKSAFLDAAKAAQAHAEKVAEQKDSVSAGNAVLETNIAALRRTMKATGFTDTQISKLIGTYAQLPKNKNTNVKAPGATNATKEVNTLHKQLKAVPPGKSITIKAPTAAAIKELRAAGYNVKRIPGSKNVRVTAPTGSAQANARALKAALDRLRNRHITVTTHYRITGHRSIPAGTYLGSTAGRSADGNIYRGAKRYANGGMERHVAQIAQPTFRMWAEPETGGEAYIPLAASKRARSTAILDDVARRFGYRLERFARGGLLSAHSMPGAQTAGLLRGVQAYAASRASGPCEVTGTLVLDSGELMGTFRGVLQENNQALLGVARAGRG